jgi:hypothetical protein
MWPHIGAGKTSMSTTDTGEYYAERARQAHGLAERAQLPEVRDIHLVMAERYARLSERAEPARPVLTVIDGGL